MICGVTSLSARRSCWLFGSLFGSTCWPRCRRTAIWAFSRSLLVNISPFTLTRICSKISARRPIDRNAIASAAATPAPTDVLLFIAKSLQPNILTLIEELAQHAAHALEHAARRARILFGGPGHRRFGEARLYFRLARAGSPPRGRKAAPGFSAAGHWFVGRGHRRRAVERQ